MLILHIFILVNVKILLPCQKYHTFQKTEKVQKTTFVITLTFKQQDNVTIIIVANVFPYHCKIKKMQFLYDRVLVRLIER